MSLTSKMIYETAIGQKGLQRHPQTVGLIVWRILVVERSVATDVINARPTYQPAVSLVCDTLAKAVVVGKVS